MVDASPRGPKRSYVIDHLLHDLSTLLRCLRCGATAFVVSDAAVTCGACGHALPVRGGVLHAASGEEDPAIDRERAAMLDMEQGPLEKPTDFSLPLLLGPAGPLRAAFTSLPYDDGSAFFRENEYFRNVSSFAASFDSIVDRLQLPPGSRVLDVGADLTWSTSRLARRGWRPVGIDINHHLEAFRVFRDAGIDFSVVNMDMHAPVFADGVFDGVTAFNALHHTHRIDPLIRNLARVLRPGGRLGFIEPYWFQQHIRDAFGVSQIEAGINENVYRLEEWHQVLVNAGFDLVEFIACPSFNAIYQKRAAGTPARQLSVDQARDDLFSAYYFAEITGPAALPGPVAPGTSFEVSVHVRNRGRGGWCADSQIPVSASYHLRVPAAQGGSTLVAFDNARSPLPGHLMPGGDSDVRLHVDAPTQPGDYLLEVDLVHEGIVWFAERGATTATIAMRVA